MKSQYKAVLFDLDGTLLNSLDDLADSMNVTLEAVGLPTHDVAKYKYFVGDGVEELARRVVPKDRADEATIRRIMENYRGHYSKRWAAKTRPYDGVPEMLDALAARGVKLAVLSNKPDDFTRLTVEKLLPGRRFDAVQGVTASGVKKPDPSGALAIARQLAIVPGEFLYLGDTNTDMQTAAAAGLFAVGALWGFRTAEELQASGAKVLIERPADLLSLL